MKRIVLALILLTCPFALAEPESDHFVSSVAGFEIRKPSSWHFSGKAEHLAQLKELKLQDAEFKRRMVERSRVPLVILMKHPEGFDDLNPTVKVQFRPMDPVKGKSAVEILNLILPSFRSVFKNFKVTKEPKATTVSGLPAAYVEMEYELETEEGRSFPTTSQVWLVPNGDFMFIIGAGTRTDEKTGGRAEIRKIVGTVKITRSKASRASEAEFNNGSSQQPRRSSAVAPEGISPRPRGT